MMLCRIAIVAAVAAFFALASGCDRNKVTEPAPRKPTSAEPPAPLADPLTRIAAPARIVAIGDLHGDLAVTRAVLRLAGAIDEKDRWAGGSLMVVQTGDQVDRGDDDRSILDMFDRLRAEASAAGGRVIPLLGNHEVMNVQLNFDYVSAPALDDFAKIPAPEVAPPQLLKLPERARPRAAAFVPGGTYARKLADREMIAQVGDTVFVHGGLLPKHLKYGLARINREVSNWMRGQAPTPSTTVLGESSPIWERRYSAETGQDDCKVLAEVLDAMQAKRMVVGHTVQRGGITNACGERVWRIDVGLSKHYGGSPEVLEIAGDRVKPLKP